MANLNKQKYNRRSLFAGSLRFFTLGLFGTAVHHSITKRNRLLREGKCISDGICTRCKVFDDCGHPQALSAKQFFKKNVKS